MARIFDFLFGCHHKRLSWPWRRKGFGQYQVCLDCGREFDYTGELP